MIVVPRGPLGPESGSGRNGLSAPSVRGGGGLRPAARGQYDHPGADRHALVQIHDVLVRHTDAAGRYAGPDRPWLAGAMEAVECVLLPLPQIHGACAHRAVWSTAQAFSARQRLQVLRDFRMLGEVLLGRIPVRPLLFAVNGGVPSPAVALAAHANAITRRPALRLHKIEEVVFGIDHDGA